MRSRTRLLVAAVACSLALAGCGEQPSEDAADGGGSTAGDRTASDTAGPAPGTTIPDDFPLSAGMAAPQDTIATSRTGTGLRDLELCGPSPLRGLGIRDRMVADNSGGESANTRELVLLGNPDEARLVAEAFADRAYACAEDGGEEMTTLTEVVDSPFGPEPATTLLQTYSFGGEQGDGATVVHVVPVGAALLVTSTYGQWTAAKADEALARTVEPLRETVAALGMFDVGSSPTEEPTEEPTAEPAVAADIPADFPLGAGLPEGDGETEVSPPSPDGNAMGEVEMCGRVVWPQGEGDDDGQTHRLATAATGPEYYDGRELVVHEDAGAALGAMAAVRRAAEECRSHDSQVWTVLDRDTGYDTVTMGLTYAEGLGSSVFQVTRVGSARLMVQTYGEGSLASLDEQADEVTETTVTIVPAMCVFTKTGC